MLAAIQPASSRGRAAPADSPETRVRVINQEARTKKHEMNYSIDTKRMDALPLPADIEGSNNEIT